MDNKQTCKICFCNDIVEMDINRANSIIQKIYTCFQIVIDPEKNFPFIVCEQCTEELNNADKFRIKCATIEERLLEFHEKLQLNGGNLEDRIENNYSQGKGSQEAVLDTCESDGNPEIEDIKWIDKNLEEEESPSMTMECFKCSLCDKVLKTLASLLKHKASMHEKRKKVGKVTGFGATRCYHCTTCSYSTPHSQTLVNHMRRHNGERPYHCECGKSFTQSSSLTAHRKTHSSTTYFTCSECGKQFKHAFALKTHLRVHDDGSFGCNICHKVLKSKQSLRSHLNRHYNIYNYNCEECGDTFITSAELLNHRKKHSSNKCLECHLCGYKTHTKRNLTVHIKRFRHAGNKSFKCENCEVAFYTLGDLRRHCRVHTREKPYPCPMCAQRFMHSTSLNKHMHTVHGVTYKWGDYKCKETRKKKITEDK